MLFFIPTGSSAERSRRPAVTIGIAVACVAVFLATNLAAASDPEFGPLAAWVDEHPWVSEGYEGERPDAAQVLEDQRTFKVLLARELDAAGGLERRLSLVPSHGFAQVGWLTNLFVHFGLFHLLGNLLFLWIVGPLLEEAWGRRKFAAFYLSAGLVASLVQFALSRHEVASIGGASGAIAGCMGAFAVRFAASRIRFLYLIWFIRPFAGSVWVPAWLCGLGWIASEVWDLKSGGAPGVATGAHVGGFALGAVIAFALRGLGFERELLTVAESREEQSRLDQLFFDGQSAYSRGDYEAARETLLALQQQAPSYPGLTLLLAEAELRGGRGQVRFERVLRELMARPDRELEALVTKHAEALDARAFSPPFAWQLAERLRRAQPVVEPELARALVEAVAAGSGAQALKARALLASHDEPPQQPAAPSVQTLEATVVSVSARGLELSFGAQPRVVPFEAIAAVHAGLIDRALVVDLVLRQGGRVVRLSGTDPRVPALFPGQAPAAAWQGFLAGLRRAARLEAPAAPWAAYGSLEAFAAARPG